mgnify:CR=1 FL=1
MKVAVIGCGNRGGDVYARLLAESGATITHLIDPDPARLKRDVEKLLRASAGWDRPGR